MIQVAIAQALCRSCDACVPVCPEHALRMRGDRLEWDEGRCRGHQLCMLLCPAAALSVLPDATASRGD